MPDDYPDNNSTTGLLWFNYPGLNANLETPGDVDWFYYPNTNPAAFVLTNAQFEIVEIIIRDANGGAVISTYYGPAANAYINLQTVPQHNYHVSVQGFTAGGAPASGTYTIAATSIIDDHGNNASTTSTIAIDGPPATGVIDVWQDWDWFRIEGMNGEPVRVELTSAAFERVVIWVNDQYGNTVASYNGLTTGASFVAPPSAYTMQIVGFDSAGNWDTGAYSVALTSIPDDHGDSVATATLMTVGGPAVVAVNEGGVDQDFFSFHADAGVPVVFDWLSLPGAGTTYTMYDQYGRSLNFLNQAISTSDYHPFTPTITGTYYIAINAGGGTSFQIVATTDDFSDMLPTSGVLVIDGPATVGRHDFREDFDVFALNVTAPGDYRVEILPLIPFFIHELLALYDANGNLLDYRGLVLPGEGLTLHFDAPGIYYIGVEELAGMVNDDHVYTLTAYSVTDDFGQTIATTGSITVDGAAVNGAINYNEDIDWLRFDVVAGQVLRFDFTTTGFAAFNFQIMNDEGVMNTWVNDSIYDDDVYYVSFTEGGTYYFALGDPVGSQTFIGTGTYSIGISSVPGEISFPDPLTIGTPEAGTITYAGGDADTFAFTAQAGQTIRFDADASYWWSLSIHYFTAGGTFEFLVLEPAAYSRAIGYTFGQTGTYFITLHGIQPVNGSTADLGGYTLHSTVIEDDAGSNAATAIALVLDGAAVNATVNFENDIDWFAITVAAGDVVHFTLTHDASITDLNWSLVGISSGISFVPGPGDSFVHQFNQAGTFYFQVEGAFWEEVGGGYTVTATSFADDYRSDVTTTGSITVGGPAFSGQLEHSSDHDWIAVELQAGETYLFTASGPTTPGNELDGGINVYNQSGVQLDSTGFTTGVSTEFLFTASYTGTHYVGVWGQIGLSSPYTLTAANFTPDLVETISPGLPALADGSFDHDHVGPPNVINVYFGENGDEFGTIVSNGWFANEIDAVMQILSVFEAYLNVDFQVTDFLPNADLVLTTFDDPGTLSVFQRADWDTPIPVIGFSHSSPLWTSAALAPGGLGGAMVLNALGYAMGLAFPHAAEGDSFVMDGVTGPFSTGDFDMNQGVYTIMSFNDGWVTSPFGISPSDAYGWQATPMAIDIAALQALYGANATANAGATSYTLGGANVAGAAWRSIWDTSGVDIISYAGSGNARIDLRAATLSYEVGGGGFLSFVEGIYGGFSIAAGVTIENASGGSGNDTLIGNAAANMLIGGSGNDVIDGGNGADQMLGGHGDDVFIVDNASDTVVEAPSEGTDTVQSSISHTLAANVENLVLMGSSSINGAGNALSNTLTGNSGANTLNGGEGNDILIGSLGVDTTNGDAGNDTFVYAIGDGNGVMNGGDGTDALSVSDGAAGSILNATWDGAALTVLSGNSLTSIETITADLGGGVDWLVYAAGSAAVTVNLATGAASGFSSIANIERVVGGNANDSLTGNGADNRLDGGAGDDILAGGGGGDTLIGSDGADVLSGGLGNDSIQGGAGADTINWAVGDGRDTIDGGADVDSFNASGTASGDLGNATWNGASLTALMDNGLANIESINLDLGGGVDWLIYNASAAVVVNLAANSASGFASVANIEKVIGGSGNDTLTGDTLDNRLDGLAGADTLDGGAGSDAVLGGDGDDIIYASAGNDSLQGQNGADTFHWTATDGRDTFNGGADTDTVNLTGSAIADVADTNWNGSAITGLMNNSLVDIEIINLDLGDGGAGGDWLRYNTALGVSVNLATGVASGFASITGVENLIGGTGNDTLTGDANVNKINGNNGDDVITGGAGNDNLTGGAGNDTFVYAAGAGNDTIIDFDAWVVGGQDFLDVSAFGINAGNFAARVAIIDTGADTVVRIDNTHFITLKNVSGDGDNVITDADFIFGP